MNLSTILLTCLLPASAAGERIEAFGHRWIAPIASDWSVEGGTVHLLVPRPSTQPRRPSQYLLADTADFDKITMDLEIRKEPAAARNRRTSVILVYAWRDAEHFNYAHLSVDSASQQPVHNGIFHVFGADRVRISATEGPATLTTEDWHKVRLAYDGTSGRVEVFVDGRSSPSLRAVNKSLGAGKVGIGSFFDLGSFRRVVIRSGLP